MDSSEIAVAEAARALKVWSQVARDQDYVHIAVESGVWENFSAAVDWYAEEHDGATQD